MGNPIRIFLDDLTYNTIGDDRQQTNPEFLFDYDIDNWIKDTSDKTLKYFRLDKKRSISFEFTDYESKIIQDELDRKNTPSGRSQALKRLHGQIQWRHPH